MWRFFFLFNSFDSKKRHWVFFARTVELFFCPMTAVSPTLSCVGLWLNSERAQPKNRNSFERGWVSLCRTAGKDFTINPGSSAGCCWNFQAVNIIPFWREKKNVQSLLQKREKNKPFPHEIVLCDDALQTFGRSYWPRDTCVSPGAFRKHLHTFSRVWVLTVSHIDSARKTHRNHGIIELWNAVQWPQTETFPSVILWHLGWRLNFLWRAAQLPASAHDPSGRPLICLLWLSSSKGSVGSQLWMSMWHLQWACPISILWRQLYSS